MPDQNIHVSRTLPYTQKQLYDVVSEVSSYQRFVPFCTSTRVVSTPPPGSGPEVPYKMELSVGFMGVEQSYISDVYYTPYEKVEAVASDETPIFTKLRSVWTFTPVTPLSPTTSADISVTSSTTQSTRFDLKLTFGFINPLHAALSAASMEKVSKKMADAFEQRCREIYGKDQR